MTEIGLSDGSRLHVARPAEDVRTDISRVIHSSGPGAAADAMWVDVGAGIHLNPAHVVYVKDQDGQPHGRPPRADRSDA
jgi:hypothetical protein